MIEKIKELSYSLGAAEVGFAAVIPPEECAGLNNAVSVVVKLSDSVVDAITDRPTYTYFHHYRTVNALIDHITLRIGILLDRAGARYVCIPASQSLGREYRGLYSHKRAAVLAGLGSVGRNALFLSKRFGCRVRLGTILTDMDLSAGYRDVLKENLCGDCMACVKACPAMALSGAAFDPECPDRALVDPSACSEYMKRNFQLIGRGSVCGICIRKCAYRGGNHV